jgi:hypothetical protein
MESDDEDTDDNTSTPMGEEDEDLDSLSSDPHQSFAPPSSFFLTEAKEQLEQQEEEEGDGDKREASDKNGTTNLHQVIESYVTESILRAVAKISSKTTSCEPSTAESSPRNRLRKKKKSTIAKQEQVVMGELSGIAHKKSPTNRFSSLSVPKSRTFFGKQNSLQLVDHIPLPEFDPIKDSEHHSSLSFEGSPSGSGVGGIGVGGGGNDQQQLLTGQSKQRMTTTTTSSSLLLNPETLENDKMSLSHPPDEDPKLTVHQLPMYFLGGVEVAGFGRILGHALALLYVARHGLKESELWSIISSMPRNHCGPNGENNNSAGGGPSAGNGGNKSRHRQPITDEMRALVSVCAHYREKFRSVWQSNCCTPIG